MSLLAAMQAACTPACASLHSPTHGSTALQSTLLANQPAVNMYDGAVPRFDPVLLLKLAVTTAKQPTNDYSLCLWTKLFNSAFGYKQMHMHTG